jgi:acetolactate synthase-1/2/3 large subunit
MTVAETVALFLKRRGIDRVFGLQGGHIQPIWDRLHGHGIAVTDVRHEAAAVHMAHAWALLTGRLGVALATAGPGVTNTVTAIANATVERVPVLLIGGCPPTFQDFRGPLQGLPHVEVLAPVTRHARTLRVAEHVLRELDAAASRALGAGCAPGAAYVELPTDVLRAEVAEQLLLAEHFDGVARHPVPPASEAVAAAAALIGEAERPLVISGGGARGAGEALVRFLDATGAAYLDTQESRGLVPRDHPSVVAAVRARAMAEADLVIVVGRRLDYQLGYGSPAVFPAARFVRIAAYDEELADNRRGAVELRADPALALGALAAGAQRASAWTQALHAAHLERRARHLAALNAPAGADGRMHPNRIFAALQCLADDAIAVADGGDILSFARLGLDTTTYLDSGALGCLGVGVPFAVAAALACPGRQVVSVSGDGAFGLNGIEIDTAARHGARAVFIVANNAAWNIERTDQLLNYGGRVVGTELAFSDYAAMARAFGLHAERVEEPDALPAAIEAALARAPALLDVVVTREAVSPDSRAGPAPAL